MNTFSTKPNIVYNIFPYTMLKKPTGKLVYKKKNFNFQKT